MPRAVKGYLVKCDPTIKQLILRMNEKQHDLVIDDLDEEHLLVTGSKLEQIKKELDEKLEENTFVLDVEFRSDAMGKEQGNGNVWGVLRV